MPLSQIHHDHHGHSHATQDVVFCSYSGQTVNFEPGKSVLTIRSLSGMSGDMFLCGLSSILNLKESQSQTILNGILPQLTGSIKLINKEVNGISGLHCQVSLPHEHVHRNIRDIINIIESANISPKAKELSTNTFKLVAEAESKVHNKPLEEVHFHEVGALDSILDICFTCELFAKLNPDYFVVSALPIADGEIHCAHGIIPSPAPAVQKLLEGIPVKPFAINGETITPTALALLKAFDPVFGPWPKIIIQKISTVYGTYEYPGVPNGAIFAYGRTYV